MEEAANKYLQRLEESGGKDLKMKRQRLTHHLIPFFGRMPLNRISSFDVQRYKAERLKQDVKVRPRGKVIEQSPDRTKKVKPSTINRELAALSHLFTKAQEWGWIEHKPAKIERFAEGQGRVVYLTVEQIHRLIDCAKADGNAQIYPFVLIALETSMRRTEILSIKREHIDLERRMIHVPRAKAGAREQPITQHLADFLASHVQALPPGTPWLFPSMGAKDGHATDIRKPFRRVVAAAGLDPDVVVRHTLRHTAITHLVQAGIDLPTVQRISGHKTLAMVMRYSHQNGAHIQAAMDKLEERYKKTA